MSGYVAQRRDRFYAAIYEGRDPESGKAVRRWHLSTEPTPVPMSRPGSSSEHIRADP